MYVLNFRSRESTTNKYFIIIAIFLWPTIPEEGKEQTDRTVEMYIALLRYVHCVYLLYTRPSYDGRKVVIKEVVNNVSQHPLSWTNILLDSPTRNTVSQPFSTGLLPVVKRFQRGKEKYNKFCSFFRRFLTPLNQTNFHMRQLSVRITCIPETAIFLGKCLNQIYFTYNKLTYLRLKSYNYTIRFPIHDWIYPDITTYAYECSKSYKNDYVNSAGHTNYMEAFVIYPCQCWVHRRTTLCKNHRFLVVVMWWYIVRSGSFHGEFG